MEIPLYFVCAAGALVLNVQKLLLKRNFFHKNYVRHTNIYLHVANVGKDTLLLHQH
jgi:hypothetical protein